MATDAERAGEVAAADKQRLDAAEWTQSLTAPRPTPKRPQKVRAA